MNQKVTKLSLVLLASLSAVHSSNSIQQPTAVLISGAAGGAAGALSYYIHNNSKFASVLIGAAVGGLTYLMAREFTPERKFERAKAWLGKAEYNLFLCDERASDRAFFDAMHSAYVTSDLPYASSYYDLSRRLECLKWADNLFEDVRTEGNATLSHLSEKYRVHVRGLIHRITEGMKRIKLSSEFVRQVKIYEERRLTQQRLAIEERKASAKEREARAKENQANAQQRQADAQERQADAVEWSWQ